MLEWDTALSSHIISLNFLISKYIVCISFHITTCVCTYWCRYIFEPVLTVCNIGVGGTSSVSGKKKLLHFGVISEQLCFSTERRAFCRSDNARQEASGWFWRKIILCSTGGGVERMVLNMGGAGILSPLKRYARCHHIVFVCWLMSELFAQNIDWKNILFRK